FEGWANTRRSNFRGLQETLREMGWDEVDGILVDLGISSVQLDHPERGFSFQLEGPLDMRLDPSSPRTAHYILRTMDEQRLTKELIQFGEGRFARKLSRWILHGVADGTIKTTKDLARVCERALGRSRGSHPATRVFLALRALVNDELGAL